MKTFLKHLHHPPVYFTLTTLIGLGCRWLPWQIPEFPSWGHWIAVCLFFMGSTLGSVSVYTFLKSKTGVIPFSPTRCIVRDGFYRYTRNPMYLGLICIQLSILISFSNSLSVVAVPVLWQILHRQFVLKEERLLLNQFGYEYEKLLSSSRRWL